MFQIKRIYEPCSSNDNYRVLIDRLWPRGIKKEDAHINLWLKDIAPSPTLRKWYNHDPKRFDEFSKQYTDELRNNPNPVKILEAGEKNYGKVTLVFAAKNPEFSHAKVLLNYLTNKKEND